MSKSSETYSNMPFGTPKRRSKRTFLGALFVIVLLALTISLSIALVIAYLTPYVSPSTFGSLTIVGIFAPVLFIMVAACMLLWLVTGRWKIALAIAIFLIPGIFRLSDFYNIDFTREVEESHGSRSFTVMSYNVRGFFDDEGERTIDRFVDYLSTTDVADVLCFQEFPSQSSGVATIDSLLNERYSQHLYQSDVTEAGNVVLRTYSRFPIVAEGEIAGQGRGTSQWVDLKINDHDTLRIFNNHLYTMSISVEDSEDIARGKILQDGDRMRSIVDRIADNSSIRANHVDTLNMVINETPYERIVCGDFNDTPMSYVYSELSHNLLDAFVEAGSGYGYTFRPMYGMLRIDYVLYSEGLESISYFANEDLELSDHLPIIVRLRRVSEM